MKLCEILNEAIESSREQITQTIEDNKELLQNQRTRIGVTSVLSKLFPGVDFRWFAQSSAAAYFPRTRRIEVGNVEGELLTPKYIRDEWKYFVKHLSDSLTHENIHKEQYKRRDHRSRWLGKIEGVFKSLPTIIKYANLKVSLKQETDPEEQRKLKKKIQKFRRKAYGRNIPLRGNKADYFSDKDEVTAYAEMIANDLVSTFQEITKLNLEYAKKTALFVLRRDVSGNDNLSTSLKSYRKHFPGGDKTRNRIIKQAVRFIEQM